MADQYLRIKCAPLSSAAPALERAPALVGTLHNRSAARDFAAAAQSTRSTPAGRRCARKKMFRSDYPRSLANCFWPLRLPALDPFPVARALGVAFPLTTRCSPVLPLSLPPRPVPRLRPAALAAIPLARLPRMEALLAAFEQTPSQPRPTSPMLPSASSLIFARACRTLGRAHGR